MLRADQSGALAEGKRRFLDGIAALDTGDFAAAAEHFEAGLVHVPGRSSLLANLALARFHLGERAEAERIACQAIAANSEDPSARMTLCQCLQARGALVEALEQCNAVLALEADHAVAWCNRGQILCALGRNTEAGAAFARALASDPDLSVAWSNQADMLCRDGNFPLALDSVDRALQIDPDNLAAWVSRAKILSRLGKLEEALKSAERALSIDPLHLDALINQGNLLADLDHVEEALTVFARLESLFPGHAEVRWNRGHVLLQQGRLEQGWGDYEARWELLDHEAQVCPQLPRAGSLSQLSGRRVLVWAEQGLGDTIQFARYLPLLSEHCAGIVFAAPPSLLRLLMPLAGGTTLVTLEDAKHDEHGCAVRAPLLSLPGLLGTSLATVPAVIPYLRAETALIREWQLRLGSRAPGARPRIALACSGNPAHPQDIHRSVPLAVFAPLVPHVELILVQRDLRESDRQALSQLAIRWVGPLLDDFASTAAVLANCDAVVSVDTSVAHLAGAQGLRLWLLLSVCSDWRWMRARTDSPWYPGIRLVRQSDSGEWGAEIDTLCDEIRRLSG
jgi:tetratricopeptide (TPR) repeat protein